MGKLLKKLFYALLICSFLYTCVYHRVNDLPENPVMSYAWSKKYGLVQYTFKDGTVFTRIGIK